MASLKDRLNRHLKLLQKIGDDIKRDPTHAKTEKFFRKYDFVMSCIEDYHAELYLDPVGNKVRLKQLFRIQQQAIDYRSIILQYHSSRSRR